MTDRPLLDKLAGVGKATPRFPDLDQFFRLKPRAYIEVGMPSAFEHISRETNLLELRREGIYPIMFYLSIEPEPVPLAFLAPVTVEYEARLKRWHANGADAGVGKGPGSDRLLLDFHFTINGVKGSGRPQDMDPGSAPAGNGEPVLAGKARVVQVVTRPLGPPEERQVHEIPPKFRVFREHRWDEPYPHWDGLAGIPEGFEALPGADSAARDSVWGLPNTDVNQHVNITEYFSKLEDHLSRLLALGGIAPVRHRVRRADYLFMKPFFAGDPFRVTGQLWRRGDETLLLGGIHKRSPSGGWPPDDARPAVGVRFEGLIEEEPGP